MQKVYRAYTRSGQFGYFTRGFLAWSLTREEYEKDEAWHVQHARKFGFEYDPDSINEPMMGE